MVNILLLQLKRIKCGHFLARHLFWFVRLPTPAITRHLPHAASPTKKNKVWTFFGVTFVLVRPSAHACDPMTCCVLWYDSP